MWPFKARTEIETRDVAAPEERSLANPSPWLAELFGVNSSIAGVAVTAQSAMRVPAVAAGVKALSEAVSILPLHAYRRNDDGSRQRDNDHPAFRLLTRATAYGQYRSMGVMTANEVRAGLNLPPLPDGNSLSNPYTSSGATDGGSDGE